MTTAYIPDQVAQALARLPSQHQGKVKIEALLTTLCQPFQDIELLLWALFTQRGIDSGIGAQLDQIGVLVGQPRAGRDDTTYRRFLRARVATNKSRGTQDEILAIAALVIGDGTVTLILNNSGPATVVLKVGNPLAADVAAVLSTYFMTRAVAAGVRIITESSTADTAGHVAHFDVSNFDDASAVFTGALDS